MHLACCDRGLFLKRVDLRPIGLEDIRGMGRLGKRADPARRAASVLSNGGLGWIQVANFLVCGGLVMAAAIGMRRALRTGRGRTWEPILIGLVGFGMILAAIFTADPVDGFPPGTPLGPPTTITTIGLLDFVTGLAGFSAWIAATFVFARASPR